MATAAKSYAQEYLDANADIKAEYERFNANDPKKWTPENYVAYHYYNYGAGEQRGGHNFKEATDTLAKQILAQGTSGKWQGQGHGSAEANARDMGKILASAGITDISQFGMVPKYLSEGRFGRPAADVVVQTGADGNPVYGTIEDGTIGSGEDAQYIETFKPFADQSKVTFKDGVPDVVIGQTYGNKVTGQPIQNTYAERQTGNSWGGTFAGDGNTGYRVQFDDKGNPIFYTTGASSNDLANMLDDPILGALAQAGAAYFGGPMGTAALNLAMGKDFKDVAKATVLSYIGGEAANAVSGSLAGTIGQTGANIAGNVTRSVVTGGDPVQALITGGIGAALPEITAQIPGFDTFGPATQKAINNTVASAIASGGDLSPDMLVRAGLTAAKDYLSSDGPSSQDIIPGYFAPGGEGYFAPPTYEPDTRGYFDEVTGHFVPDENGALNFGDLTNETSGTNIGSMADYQYNQETGNWTLPDGTVIDTSYMQNSKTPLTGQQVMSNAGASAPKTPAKPATPAAPGTAAKPGTPGAGVDMNALMSLLGGGQQAAPTVVSSGQDNSADVQLMEQIFGNTLSAPPAGDTATQTRELARLMRS